MLNKQFIKVKIEYIQRDLNRLEPMADLTINEVAKDYVHKSVDEAIKQYAKYCGYILKFIEK